MRSERFHLAPRILRPATSQPQAVVEVVSGVEVPFVVAPDALFDHQLRLGPGMRAPRAVLRRDRRHLRRHLSTSLPGHTTERDSPTNTHPIEHAAFTPLGARVWTVAYRSGGADLVVLHGRLGGLDARLDAGPFESNGDSTRMRSRSQW